MKKIYICLIICLVLLTLAACTPSDGGADTTDVTTQAPATDAPPETEAREYMRVGFLYPYADSWRFDFGYYRVGETPALPEAHTPDAYFIGWELNGAISELLPLEAVGELVAKGEPQSRVGGHAELLSLCGECHYAYVAKYEYPEKVTVSVMGADSNTYTTEVDFGQKLPASLIENAYLPPLAEGERVDVAGWLYSADGNEWETYDSSLTAKAPVFLKPDVKYYCLLTLNAGKGNFKGEPKLEIWHEKGATVNVSELEAPTRDADGEKVYTFSAYKNTKGEKVSEVTMTSAVTLKADYDVSEKIYTVTVVTERGSLPGGGKSATFTLGYSSALEIVDKYKNATYELVSEDGEFYETRGVELFQNDTVWTVIVKWRNAASYTISFEQSGEVLFTETVHKGETLTLPDRTREDEVGYYAISGWLDKAGVLHPVGEELSVQADIILEAQWEISEKKVYTAVFTTDKGKFADGSTTVKISGYYGDALVAPEPPAADTLVYGNVVFTFAGWSKDIPTALTENAEYSAVYTFEQPVYYLTYMIDGETYVKIPYYAGSAVTLITIDESDGVRFDGWYCDDKTIDISSGSFAMPSADTVLYGTFERAEFSVFYYVDGVLTYTDTHLAGTTVALRPVEEKTGHTFEYVVSVDEVVGTTFVMPAEDVRVDGVFVPNVHNIIFYDMEGGNVIFSDEIEYSSEFSISDIEFYRSGEYTSGWTCISGLPNGYGDDISMPDNDVVFVAAWSPTLTVGLDGVWLPYYGSEEEAEFDGFFYNADEKILYIYDAALVVEGEAEGISVVYKIEAETTA